MKAASAKLVLAAALASIAPLALSACHKSAQPVTELMTADPDEWPSWGRTGSETHYSPLDDIDADNVAGLKLAWHFDLEPGYSPTTPLMAEGKVFITTGHSHIRAFDAETGKLLWEYDGGTRERATSSLQLGWGNKGIAYDAGRVFLATTDGYVAALDANTGKEAWKAFDPPADGMPRQYNGPVRVFGGKVIVGYGGADISPARGFVTAYDAKTGKRAWRFYTTPGDEVTPVNRKAEEVMRKTWPSGWKKEDGSRRGGGGTMWNAFSYDPELGLIYLGVGNGFPYNQDLRSPGGGDNLFLASIVAVDANTGAYKWHYQVCPAEQWDCTATTDMTLATLKIDGKERKVLMQAPKNGFFYVLDRTTGKLINEPGKIGKVTWADKIDMKTGRPVVNPGMRYQGKPGLFEMWPGPTGAHSWMPQAYNPGTGLVYIPEQDMGALIGEGQKGGGEIAAGMGVTLIPEVELPGGHKSYLKAWDPVTQTERWKVELPGSWPGGVMTSAGDLVFQGQMDGKFVARDAQTGKELWSFKTASPIVGAPITYRMNGKQYVTVITGAGGQGAGMQTLGNAAYRTDYRFPRRVLTFTLDGTDSLPPFAVPARTPPADPDFKADAKRSQAGFMVFANNGCLVCHGWNAVAGGSAPDLRYSPVITDADTFRMVVKEGGLKLNGMPPFSNISNKDLEDLRFFLRTRAQQAPAEEKALQEKLKAAKLSTAKPQDFPGKWNIVIQSPMGPQKAVLELKVDGNVVTGKATAEQGSVDLAGGFKDGRIRIEGKASMPMPITISYDLTVKDGELQGDNSNGPFGTFPVTGTR
ncbi:PQQ-dependent dehydrogenase, methanol/ethanol family [Novosphingobium album (ex Hu et al. 2023)]|uniref:PQQ-dependent dehydrogenase, methanol/ethanol family n=1 Tax=Novosphingobium album (ex Hu et al. 2023) TaxID=2930093 RepID=A0ABT0B2R7_9SPHN|nr:PQQ-dependent dehydrogenase, methanol/ethanol family [Novosphingobium album (ex Hu et al. 2023)]MCJ2179330.1 PQQ-dependent dehydrogenase, methanol/ethanol family [Novosphingobium album (ex Hu et al. 2023)]